MIIAMIIIGGLNITAFALYEKFLAPVTFAPFSILTDRTVLFGGLMHVFVIFSLLVWFSFFNSMSQVVYGLLIRILRRGDPARRLVPVVPRGWCPDPLNGPLQMAGPLFCSPELLPRYRAHDPLQPARPQRRFPRHDANLHFVCSRHLHYHR